MSAFFGIEENQAQGFIEQGIVCLPNTPSGHTNLHGIVGHMRAEDIVFVKHCTHSESLHVKAVGIVHSDYHADQKTTLCLPVEWVWQGDKVIENTDENMPFCNDPFYEEHNIVAQHEIIALLPTRFRLSPEGSLSA